MKCKGYHFVFLAIAALFILHISHKEGLVDEETCNSMTKNDCSESKNCTWTSDDKCIKNEV